MMRDVKTVEASVRERSGSSSHKWFVTTGGGDSGLGHYCGHSEHLANWKNSRQMCSCQESRYRIRSGSTWGIGDCLGMKVYMCIQVHALIC